MILKIYWKPTCSLIPEPIRPALPFRAGDYYGSPRGTLTAPNS